MLKSRVITSVFLALALSSAIIFLPAIGLAAMVAGVVAISAWEWANLSAISTALGKCLYSLSVLVLIAAVVHFSQLYGDVIHWSLIRDILGLGCLWWAFALLWVKTYPGSAVIWGAKVTRLVMGFLVLVPAWAAFASLRLHDHGVVLIFVLVGIVASADIGAYFSGKAWGNSKLSPNVSPGKSMAGFWGGLATSTTLVVALWFIFDHSQYSLIEVIVVAVLSSLASVLGDLLESMVKRHRGIKDSGNILPGHGGLMDRIDGFTAAAPVFVLSLMLVGS